MNQASPSVTEVSTWLHGTSLTGVVQPESRVVAALFDRHGLIRAADQVTAEVNGRFVSSLSLTDAPGVPPGSNVELTVDGRHDKTLAVPYLEAIVFAPAEAVEGHGPPGERLELVLDPPYAFRGEVMTGPDGSFRFDLAGTGIQPGTVGTLILRHPDGNYNLRTEALAAEVQVGADEIKAWATAGNMLDAWLETEGGRVLARSEPTTRGSTNDGTRLQLRDETGDGRPIQPDDLLGLRERASAGGAILFGPAPVPRLMATIDAQSRAVSGSAPASAQLTVEVIGPEFVSQEVQADAGGRWRAEFPDLRFEPGTSAIVYLREPDPRGSGDSPVVWTARAVVPRLEPIRVHGAEVSGLTAPSSEVTAVLLDGRSGQERAAGTARAAAGGSFRLELRDAAGRVAVSPSDRVRISLLRVPPDQVQVFEAVAPELWVTPTVGARILSGVAPAGRQLRAWVCTDGGCSEHFGQADASGRFDIDLAGRVLDRAASGSVAVHEAEASFYAAWSAARLEVDATSDVVMVRGTPPMRVALELQTGGDRLWSHSERLIDTSLFLPPRVGDQRVDIRPEQSLQATIGLDEISLNVPDLSARYDAPGTVRGQALPGRTVTVQVFGLNTYQLERVITPADSEGRFRSDLSADYRLELGGWLRLQSHLADGHVASGWFFSAGTLSAYLPFAQRR